MSKKFKSSASSSRVQPNPLVGGFGSNALSTGSGFGTGFGAATASQLSYVYEPPDLSSISEPSVVVSLKNLQKKDGTTKAKALDELLSYLDRLEKDGKTPEDGVIEAWTKLYGRTSIDNTRQVRQRAHVLQGRLTSICGKRIAKALPTLVGPWLCGLQDNDKLVVRSAYDALSSSFPTEEKRAGVWKVYHKNIVEYCSHTILDEEVKTLSDERATSQDDAESKYFRTIGSAILTLSRSLESSPKEQVDKESETYSRTFDSGKFWTLASSKDSFARQAVYNASLTRLSKFADSFDNSSLKNVSDGLIGKALRVDQTGSSTAFLRVLASMTEAHPSIWTTLYSGKKQTSAQNLEHFLRNLPISTTPEFWTCLGKTFETLPSGVLGSKKEGAEEEGQSLTKMLEALLQGMTRREHFQAGQGSHWRAYLVLAKQISSPITNQEGKDQFAQAMLCPLAKQYIIPETEKSRWNISDPQGLSISMEALIQADGISASSSSACVSSISEALIESMQVSLPEQAKGFRESQLRIRKCFAKWAEAKLFLLENDVTSDTAVSLRKSTASEATASMQVLQSRNGKPFGATGGIELALSLLSKQPDEALKGEIKSFLMNTAPNLVGSPSTDQLLVIFRKADVLDPNLKLYETCLQSVVKQPSSPKRGEALVYFIEAPWPAEDGTSRELSQIVRESIQSTKMDNAVRSPQLNAALQNPTTPRDLTDEILEMMMGSLSLENSTFDGLESISNTADKNQDALRSFLKSSKSTLLAPKLLLLSQSNDNSDMKKKAEHLSSKVQLLSIEDGNSQAYTNTLLTSIHESLQGVSLGVNAILDLAHQVLKINHSEPATIQELLPSPNHWQKVLRPHFAKTCDPSLAITNDLGASIYLIKPADEEADVYNNLSYDSEGLSPALRTVEYTIKLISTDSAGLNLDKVSLCYLGISNQLLSDNLSMPAAIPLWKDSGDLQAVSNILSSSQNIARSHSLEDVQSRESILLWLAERSKDDSVFAYYAARAYVTLFQELLEVDPSQILHSDEELISVVRKRSVSMYDAALSSTSSQSSSFSRLVNTLIAELARFEFEENIIEGVRLMNLLSILVASPSFQEGTVTQKHRLVLFVKHLIATISKDSAESSTNTLNEALSFEIFGTLAVLVPFVKDIFDDFWEDLVEVLTVYFEAKSISTSVLYVALKLYGKLNLIASDTEETNEDFVESWPRYQRMLESSLVALALTEADKSDTEDQPEQIVHSLLGRYVKAIKSSNIEIDALYPALLSQSESLQVATYSLLHRNIAAQQEKVTLDAALTKDFKATLPEALVSITKASPVGVDDFTSEPTIPANLLRYILGWKLIFDHWTGASYQVQNDYVNQLKETDCVKFLVELLFDYTISNRLRPFDASKVSFEDFDLDSSETVEKHVVTLLCHLYLLSLKHTPSLVRSWWRDGCPRALQRPVEEWTEKYMSARVVSAELAEVSRWAPKQETDTPLEIKVASRAREVTAMYPVDEQMAAIRISLPANYPLSTIVAEDLNRVGVEERKWHAWLVNAQGIMNFAPSSGGIGAVTDGLVAWRRNVTGTLKGQSECAICYSIVNADRQLPTKTCGTCKNSFHGTCLFRWFKSSGSSSCPLCRNPFNYG